MREWGVAKPQGVPAVFDLVIKNGTIVDGTGRSQYRGDIAIADGALVQVGGTVTGDAREVIDADGLIVTPGFVDVHSHYDGQVTFDDVLEPSAGHGVTTVVIGSCGIGFAPARPEDHDRLIEVMEFVEDIPAAVLHAALPWAWETFPEYLDFIEHRQFSMDVGTMVGHVAVRINVMGERGVRNEEATSADIDSMATIVRDGIDAGALGFSTSRVVNHKTANGDPVPGTYAGEDELFGIAAAMSGAGYSVFQLAQSGADGDGPEEAIKELDWMRRLSAEFGLPVSFLMLQVQRAPDLWKELLDGAWEARQEGAMVVPQVANRPFGMLLGLTNRHPFVMRPTFAELAARHDSLDALVAELAKPEVRAQILSEEDTAVIDDRFATMGMIASYMPEMVFPFGDDVDYEPTADKSLGARRRSAWARSTSSTTSCSSVRGWRCSWCRSSTTATVITTRSTRCSRTRPPSPASATAVLTSQRSVTRRCPPTSSRTGCEVAPAGPSSASRPRSRCKRTTPPSSTGSATGAPSKRARRPT